MLRSDATLLVERAEAYLGTALDAAEREPPLVYPAFECARTAAELAGKAMLLVTAGSYPHKGASGHSIGGVLHEHHLVPPGCDPRRLAVLLRSFTRAVYDLDGTIEPAEVEEALRLASLVVQHARRILARPAGAVSP